MLDKDLAANVSNDSNSTATENAEVKGTETATEQQEAPVAPGSEGE